MTDTAAIRTDHIPVGQPRICMKDEQDWPCDAHVLGVALEEAEAREQRLRAALDEVVASGLFPKLAAALATTSEGRVMPRRSDPRLDALRRLADKSTGEWAFEADSEGLQLTVGDDRHTFITPEAAWTDQDWADAAFLTASANYVRDALATTPEAE